MTDKDIAELQLKVWEKAVDVQQHFNDLALRIRNLFVTLLAATLAVVGYGIKAVPVQSSTVSLSALILPYIPFVTALGIAICFAFWFLDRLWYHRLLRGAVKMGTELEARLQPQLGDIGLTRTIGEESHMKFGPFTLDATLRLDFFYGLFVVVLVITGERIESVTCVTAIGTFVVIVALAGIAVWRAFIRVRGRNHANPSHK